MKAILATVAMVLFAALVIGAIVWGMQTVNDPASPACDADCTTSTPDR